MTQKNIYHNLLSTLSSTACITLLSRIFGFLRDIMLASVFGAGPHLDLFIIAFRIPNFLRRLFAEGAFSQAFVPILARYRDHYTTESLQKFLSSVLGILSLSVFVLVVVVEYYAPQVIRLLAPGLSIKTEAYTLTTSLLRITFPYLFFITLVSFLGSILNVHHRFLVSSAMPIIVNVALILAASVFSLYFSPAILALAWGVLCAGVLQLLIQYIAVRPYIRFSQPKIVFSPAIKRLLKRMIPALLGVSIAQISLLVDTFFASFLPAGSISWLYYSDRLTYFPLGIIGVALATVVLPMLSQNHSKGANEQYNATLNFGLRLACLTGFPASVGLYILSGPLLSTLIHHGKFGAHDLIMTQQALMAYAIGVPGFILIKILGSAFYAKEDIRTPVKIAMVCTVLNIILNFIFIKYLLHVGLALSTALAATVNALLLSVMLIKKGHFRFTPGWPLFLLRIIIACISFATLLHYFCDTTAIWMQYTRLHSIVFLALFIGLGIATYVACLFLSGFKLHHLKTHYGLFFRDTPPS